MSVSVTVVIPNWNGLEFLEICLTSLREQSFKNFETVLVDNGSTDGSRVFVRQNFPEVRYIALTANKGFSAAANAGIEASDSEYVALLNNDTEVDPGWLEVLTQAAGSHLEAGFFASKLINFHDRRFLDGAGDALRLSGLPYRLGHSEKDRGQLDVPSSVFGACGAAAMYRRAMLEEVGLFDEDFGSYCEDGDLSFRSQLAGYGCLYVPDAVVYHMGSASTGGKRSATATRLGTRNSLSLLVKNLPLNVMPHVLPFFAFGQLARLLTSAVTGTLRAHVEGLLEARRYLPLMLEKRRRIQKNKKVSDTEVRRILWRSQIAATKSIMRRLCDSIGRSLRR